MFNKRFRSIWIVATVLLVSLIFASALDAGNHPRLTISSIGLSKRIVEFPLAGDSWYINPWEKNVGHLEATSEFDSPGNMVLAGHSKLPNGKAGIFYHLDSVAIGDDITIFDGSAERHYSVTEIKMVSQYDLDVILPTSDDRLTLITCQVGSYDRKTQSYTKRLAVIAQRIG